MALDIWNRAWFERYAPIFLGALSLLSCWYFRSELSASFEPGKWDSSNLYSAVFNWSSIQSGFLFAIYGFIVTKRDGFVGKIFGGRAFSLFIKFTGRACVGGFVLTITSLPLLVSDPDISQASTVTFYLISLWFSFFVWAFFAFLRVAFSFGLIVATPDRPQRSPG